LRPRTRWLKHRFAAERVRAITFKLFAFVQHGLNEEIVARETKAELDRLNKELRRGVHAIQVFSPNRAFGHMPEAREVDAATLTQAWGAYDKQRLHVQSHHFGQHMKDNKSKMRRASMFAELFFIAAAFLSLADAALVGWNLVQPAHAFVLSVRDQAMFYFWVWALFVASAMLLVFREARGLDANVDRYEQYKRELDALPQKSETPTPAAFVTHVHDTELIVLRELGAFLHDHHARSYLY